MPRDGSGNYAIPNTFTPNSVIASAAVNANFADIATALTGSLARNSEGPMTAALLLHADGALFEVDPDTGFIRVGANEAAIRVGGSNVVVVSTSTVSIAASINITGALTLAGALNFAAGATISMTGSSVSYTPIETISTEAGAVGGPILSTYRDSASPAVNDSLGQVRFHGKDSGGNKTTYGYITAVIADPTNGSEDGQIHLVSIVNGVETTVLNSSGGNIQIPGAMAVTGAVTGASQTVSGDQSAGTASGSQIASQAEQEAASVGNKLVTPGNQHNHPSASKSWGNGTNTGSVNASYNVTSLSDNGNGDATWVIATEFSSGNYSFQLGGFYVSGGGPRVTINADVSAPTSGTLRIRQCDSTNGTLGDNLVPFTFSAFGDQ